MCVCVCVRARKVANVCIYVNVRENCMNVRVCVYMCVRVYMCVHVCTHCTVYDLVGQKCLDEAKP